MSEENIKPWPHNPKYKVSDTGKIYYTKRGTSGEIKELTLQKNIKGYWYASLTINGGNRYVSAHKMVLETFVGDAPEGLQCAHLDGNKDNNHINNLKWVTAKENTQHKKAHGTYSAGKARTAMHHWSSKLKPSQIIYMKDQYKKGASLRSLADKYGLEPPSVRDIVEGKTWRYLDDDCRVYSLSDLAERDLVVKQEAARECYEIARTVLVLAMKRDNFIGNAMDDLLDEINQRFGLEG